MPTLAEILAAKKIAASRPDDLDKSVQDLIADIKAAGEKYTFLESFTLAPSDKALIAEALEVFGDKRKRGKAPEPEAIHAYLLPLKVAVPLKQVAEHFGVKPQTIKNVVIDELNKSLFDTAKKDKKDPLSPWLVKAKP
jgi:hypothetical protein